VLQSLCEGSHIEVARTQLIDQSYLVRRFACGLLQSRGSGGNPLKVTATNL
jgi:hypothetical protein